MNLILVSNGGTVILCLATATAWSSAVYSTNEDLNRGHPVLLATSLSNFTQNVSVSSNENSDNFYWNQDLLDKLSKKAGKERNDDIQIFVTRFRFRTTTPKPKDDISNSSRFWRTFGFISIAVLIIMTFMLLQKLRKGMASGEPYPDPMSPEDETQPVPHPLHSGQGPGPPPRERRRSLFRHRSSEDRPPPYSEVADLPAYPSAPVDTSEQLPGYQISYSSPASNSREVNVAVR